MLHRTTRRALAGASALGQGALGIALIALAALVFLPGAQATPQADVVKAR